MDLPKVKKLKLESKEEKDINDVTIRVSLSESPKELGYFQSGAPPQEPYFQQISNKSGQPFSISGMTERMLFSGHEANEKMKFFVGELDTTTSNLKISPARMIYLQANLKNEFSQYRRLRYLTRSTKISVKRRRKIARAQPVQTKTLIPTHKSNFDPDFFLETPNWGALKLKNIFAVHKMFSEEELKKFLELFDELEPTSSIRGMKTVQSLFKKFKDLVPSEKEREVSWLKLGLSLFVLASEVCHTQLILWNPSVITDGFGIPSAIQNFVNTRMLKIHPTSPDNVKLLVLKQATSLSNNAWKKMMRDDYDKHPQNWKLMQFKQPYSFRILQGLAFMLLFSACRFEMPVSLLASFSREPLLFAEAMGLAVDDSVQKKPLIVFPQNPALNLK